MALPPEVWRNVSWRPNETLSFSLRPAVRVRPASRHWKLAAPHPLEWLLVEWPEGGYPEPYRAANQQRLEPRRLGNHAGLTSLVGDAGIEPATPPV